MMDWLLAAIRAQRKDGQDRDCHSRAAGTYQRAPQGRSGRRGKARRNTVRR